MAPLTRRDGRRARVLMDGSTINYKMKGVGRYAFNLALEIGDRLGYRVDFFIAVTENVRLPEFPEGFQGKLVYIPPSSEVWLGLVRFPRLIRAIEPDAFVRAADKIGWAYRIPTVTICHDLNKLIWAQQPRRPFPRRALDFGWEILRVHGLRSSELVICNSKYVRQEVISEFRLDPSRLDVAHCGVDKSLLRSADEADQRSVRRRVAGSVGLTSYILTFATGDEREGYCRLPKLWRAAKKSGYPGALAIAGVDGSAPYARQLKARLAEECGLADVVWLPFLGEARKADLAALYASADFYLELSLHEGFGMQLLEAMACGAVCLSSGCGALDEVGGGFPIRLPLDPEQSGYILANEWRKRSHYRDATEQLSYARRFTWEAAGRKVADFLLSNVGEDASLGELC